MSVNLGYTKTTEYEENNIPKETSTFSTTTGGTKAINDVWFTTNTQDTVGALPDYRGAGRVGNLSAAMYEIEREVA